jgi:hypothetical protein
MEDLYIINSEGHRVHIEELEKEFEAQIQERKLRRKKKKDGSGYEDPDVDGNREQASSLGCTLEE